MASQEIEELVSALAKLPGLGPRSARRAVLHLVKKRETALPALLDEMDEHRVAKAILMDNLVKPSVTARAFAEQRPDRFAVGDKFDAKLIAVSMNPSSSLWA